MNTPITVKFNFKIASPERLLFSDEIDMAVIPGERGDFGVLSSHAPLVTTLRSGLITIHKDGNIHERIYVADGFAHINEQGCIVLAEESIFLSEMDASMLEQTIKKATEELALARTEEEQSALKRDLSYIQSKLELLRRTNYQ